jgi:ribosome biogenesis GTPase / thiamine phosphate phosphatase
LGSTPDPSSGGPAAEETAATGLHTRNTASARPAAHGFGHLDLGLVVAAHGRHLFIETPEGQRVRCHARGKKLDAVVGDRVRWQPTGDEGVVESVDSRRNLLFRQDEARTKSFAANLDQLLILVAGEPMFSESQLTRALIAAESADVPARIGLNKVDLPAAAAARERLQPYAAMGVPIVDLALKADAAASHAVLAPLLAERVTLVLGPSGTGKSTLVNLLAPGARALVGELSAALGTGRHTTTSTSWYWLNAARDSALIDSPGFQSFGLAHIEPMRLAQLMPDLRLHAGECRFNNCTHRQEPGCGVQEAAKSGVIAASRYAIYLDLFEELSALPKW